MVISCPECNGKLSTAAPRCPHCGYAQKPVALQNAAAGSAPPSTAGTGSPEFVPPSRAVLKEAARKQWLQWQHDSFWPMAFGILMIVVVLGLLGITFFLLNQASMGRP